ncbi:uncharacterized protein LOC118441250 [Vespa mandarinia]|uniref:uncharacterized protein LOC118441250 n=1 Tax=Vespa mandarinia TaxID=7446 RepID=UPI0016159F50|nr:uncharacterized protein LOC118441250 [Vespa mandarinia]
MEYTLKDTHEDLTDLQVQMRKEIEDIANVLTNNKITVFKESCTSEEVKMKQHKMAYNILKHIPKIPPKDYPIPKTIDIRIDTLNDLEKEILNAQSLLEKTQQQLQSIEKDIVYLENKKNGFNKMREMYLVSEQTLESKTYDDELSMTKRLFRDTKEDLHNVVEMLFPENEKFSNFLSALVSAYTKGGDDIYVDVIPETLDAVKFLVEADIATYHPNDKNKIKMVELL